jgi:5'-methylthioadenosine phosphorylase
MLTFLTSWLDGGDMDRKPVLGVIGGSGLYRMDELEAVEEIDFETPYGKPSSPIILGELDGKAIAFLARHGMGHFISPSEINYRANIYALKSVGVEQILAVSACGSLRDDFEPGEIVIPDQLFDHTKGRKRSFFEDGFVAHISIADPFCPDFSPLIAKAVSEAGGSVHTGGAFITIEGPRFSTRVESNTFRAWGMSIIGMTSSPEAFLAREAELCYAAMAHVTDYDVWHIAEDPVTVEMVIRILLSNTALAQQVIKNLVSYLPQERGCECGHALRDALITDPTCIPAETRERLSLLVERYLR